MNFIKKNIHYIIPILLVIFSGLGLFKIIPYQIPLLILLVIGVSNFIIIYKRYKITLPSEKEEKYSHFENDEGDVFSLSDENIIHAFFDGILNFYMKGESPILSNPLIIVEDNHPDKLKNPKYVAAVQKEWYEENAPFGKDLGYPECCIKAFCDDAPPLIKSRNANASQDYKYRLEAANIKGEYSGFIPCSHHAKQILKGEITLASLIKNRSDKFKEFPIIQ